LCEVNFLTDKVGLFILANWPLRSYGMTFCCETCFTEFGSTS